MELKGIDVSKHNGKINWNLLKGNIDFAIIRAGYGKNHIDVQLENNVHGCKNNNILFGLYWFSYALNKTDAYNEANYICDLADKYNPEYPICFDWEYDSDKNAEKKGVILNNSFRESFADTFLSRVEERGYFAVNYSNIDYLNKGFKSLLNKYALWLASWTSNKPMSCAIWQYSSTAKFNGISGKVDANISYVDFKELNNSRKEEIKRRNEELEIERDTIFKNKLKNYLIAIEKVVNGEYGTGNERKEKLESQQYDYKVIQDFINTIAGMK